MKTQKSIRLDATTARRVDALQQDGESWSAACERVILAGADAMESGDGGGQPQPQDGFLARQLEAKDAQIAELMTLVSQGQQLAAMAAGSKPTLAQRFRALIGRGGAQDGR